MNQKVTDQELLNTVDKMRATEKEKQVMRERIKNGDGNLKFAVYGTMLRMRRDGRVPLGK